MAVIDDELYLNIYDIETIQIKKKKEYDIKKIIKFLDQYSPDNTLAVIENIHAYGSDSANRAFCFGEGFGVLKGVLTSYGFDYKLVTPQTWKNFVFGTKINENIKNISISKALSLFPDSAKWIKLKKHHNRAEALLIAYYGIQNF